MFNRPSLLFASHAKRDTFGSVEEALRYYGSWRLSLNCSTDVNSILWIKTLHLAIDLWLTLLKVIMQ